MANANVQIPESVLDCHPSGQLEIQVQGQASQRFMPWQLGAVAVHIHNNPEVLFHLMKGFTQNHGLNVAVRMSPPQFKKVLYGSHFATQLTKPLSKEVADRATEINLIFNGLSAANGRLYENSRAAGKRTRPPTSKEELFEELDEKVENERKAKDWLTASDAEADAQYQWLVYLLTEELANEPQVVTNYEYRTLPSFRKSSTGVRVNFS